MKVIRFLFALGLTLTLVYYLNFSQGSIPPIGKFLNPFMGFWQNGEKEALDISETIKSDKLKGTVTVKWDDLMIPHVFAQNDYDLYFTQGYLTAYHRLWQMDFQVKATAGRLSEIIGERTVNFDRTKRRKGLKYAAQRAIAAIEKEPELLNMMQAYTDGVNHYIEHLSYKDYPIEYKMLDYTPESWTNLKTALLLKYMAEMLSGGENDLENTNALKLFGRDSFELLFPETFKEIDPVIPSTKQWDFEPIKVERPDVNYPLNETATTIEHPDPQIGSNNFVVAGSKTASGNVILANEPDLSLNLPSLWYVIQLNAPGVNVFGATLPGSPGVIIGFNDSIAWGATNATRDVVDWYQIEFRDDKRKEYRYDDQWLKTEKVIEEIKIRNGESLYDTIIHTHYGPVVYDRHFMDNNEKANYAMKWTAHEQSLEVRFFYLMNRGKNYDDYTEALKSYVAPAQNFAFGSANGDIAIWIAGEFPVKWEEQGKFLMDGSDSRFEWNGFIPHDHKAYVKNPAQGFVSSANQHPVDSTYPYYAYDYSFEYYRNRRINDRLKLLNNIRVEDMMKLQNDNFNYQASESLPLMLDSLDTSQFDNRKMEAYGLLRRWDYFNEPERLAPSIYKEWWSLLYPKIWDELSNQEIALGWPSRYNTIKIMNEDPANDFFDVQRTEVKETAIDLINQSFVQAIDSLDRWKERNGTEHQWYLYKNTRINHLIPGMRPFSVEKVKIGGDRGIVNAASGRWGPSWRMVVELTPNGAKAWGVYPGSQTGNPGNPNYAHMVEDWALGNYYQMNFLRSAEETNDKIIYTQTFESEAE